MKQEDSAVKRKKIMVFLIAFVLGGATAYWFFREPPAKKAVEKRFQRLQAVITKEPGESGPAMALKNEQLPRLFADSVELKGNIPFLAGKHSAESLGTMIMQLRMRADTVDLQFQNLQIELVSDSEAKAQFTATTVAASKYNPSEKHRETRTMQARLVKTDETWRFAEFEVIKETEP